MTAAHHDATSDMIILTDTPADIVRSVLLVEQFAVRLIDMLMYRETSTQQRQPTTIEEASEEVQHGGGG